MASHFEQYADEPIVVVTLPRDYRMDTDFEVAAAQYNAVLESAEEPVYWIVDTREWLFDLDQLVLGASQVARGDNPLYHHPKIKQVLYVTTGELVPAMAKGMSSDTFGHIDVKVFSTLEAALDHVHADRAAAM